VPLAVGGYRSGMPDSAAGLPPSQLSDETLVRDVEHLHETRHETFLHGTHDAFTHHTTRMLELEQEFLRRFPERVLPEPLRTRAGSRRAAGQ